MSKVSLSIPTDHVALIDEERGDVPRSTFITRILEAWKSAKEGGR